MRFRHSVISLLVIVLSGCVHASNTMAVPRLIPPVGHAVQPHVIQGGQNTNWTFFDIQPGVNLRWITPGTGKDIWIGDDNGLLWHVDMLGNGTRFQPGETPFDLTVGPDRNVWFAVSGHNLVGRMTQSGATTFFNLPFDAEEITTGPDGNLWLTMPDSAGHNNGIARVTPYGVVTSYILPDQTIEPFAIAAGPDGNVWFTGDQPPNGPGAIGVITSQGAITTYTVPTPGGFPIGITSGPDGNIWFSDSTSSGSGQVGRVTPSGSIQMYNIPEPNGFPTEPELITSGPLKSLWFGASDGTGKEWVFRCTTSGVFTAHQDPAASGGSIFGIAAGVDGNLWFTDTGNSLLGVFILRVLSVSPSTLTFTGPGLANTLTVSEAHYSRGWTAATTNKRVATVVPGGQSNQFTVTSVGKGFCTILVKDSGGNSFPVSVTVQ